MSKQNVRQINPTNNPVVEGLQNQLRASYSLFLATHNYHWNIEGSKFVSLHELFEKQYTALFKAIDEVAERIRALDEYALPFEDERIVSAMTALENPLVKKLGAEERADMMVSNLIELNKKVINESQAAKEAAVKAEDDETEDLLIERITAHQEANWMLRSIIKK